MLQLLLGAVPPLLTLYWVLAVGAVVVTLLPIPGIPAAFRDAVRLSAARGKLWSTRPTTLGALNNLSVPQAWFGHFYAIGLACNAVLLVVAAGMLRTQGFGSALGPHTFIALALFLAHLLRRLLETWHMMVYPAGARMHVIAYVFGLSYYIVAPLSILGDSFWAASDMPGSLVSWVHQLAAADTQEGGAGGGAGARGVAQAVVGDVVRAPVVLRDACIRAVELNPLTLCLGAGIMVAGFAIQCHSHWVLAQLARRGTQRSRSRSSGSGCDEAEGVSSTPATGLSAGSTVVRSRAAAIAGAQGQGSSGSGVGAEQHASQEGSDKGAYQIPHGGLFELVSCPHYLGEVVIYMGLAVLTWPALRPRLMLLWVVVNLVLAAGATQQWYRAAFPDYPRNRRALIPGIY